MCDYTDCYQCPDYTSRSLKISQLKNEIMHLDEDDRAYNILLEKYNSLQKEYQLINNEKIHLEYELKKKKESKNKLINELKCQNMDLCNELTQKNSIYEKLKADNCNLLQNLEEKKKENQNFCRTVNQNDNMISNITQDKVQFEHDAMILNDTSKKNEENIKNLCAQINCLKIQNRSQNDELTKKNYELNQNEKCLNEIKCDNANLNNQMNLKNSALDNIQSQLNIANKTIMDLNAELNLKKSMYEKNKSQLQNLEINLKDESGNRIRAENENMKLDHALKEREDNLNKLNYLNEALKCDQNKLCEEKNKLMNDIAKYKNHVMILTEQTQQLTNELQKIVDEDSALYNLNNAQIQRLQKIICENKKLLNDEIEAIHALENYVKCSSKGSYSSKNNY